MSQNKQEESKLEMSSSFRKVLDMDRKEVEHVKYIKLIYSYILFNI